MVVVVKVYSLYNRLLYLIENSKVRGAFNIKSNIHMSIVRGCIEPYAQADNKGNIVVYVGEMSRFAYNDAVVRCIEQ